MTALPPEQVLWQGRPSNWNWWAEHLLAALILGAGLAAGFAREPRAIPLAGAAAGLLWLRSFIKRRSRLYKVTTQRVVEERGFLSKRVSEVEIGDIRSINLAQGFFQRLVGIGHVEISSAAGEGVEVTFADIADATAVKELIRRARLGVLPEKTRAE